MFKRPGLRTNYEEKLKQRSTKVWLGSQRAPHFRNHSARRINRFVMQQTRWSPQCTPNWASSRSTAHVATTPWTSRQRPGRNGTSVSVLHSSSSSRHRCILGLLPWERQEVQHMVPKRYAVPTQHFGCHRHSRRFRHQRLGNGGTSLIFCN